MKHPSVRQGSTLHQKRFQMSMYLPMSLIYKGSG